MEKIKFCCTLPQTNSSNMSIMLALSCPVYQSGTS